MSRHARRLTHVQAKDLRDILNLYQLWAHGMFPKGDFEGTIKRVETLCRGRRMEVRESFPISPRLSCPLPFPLIGGAIGRRLR